MEPSPLPVRPPRATGAPAAARLADDSRPLDWNGPVNRPFTRFADADLQRPVVELVERFARTRPDRVAISSAIGTLTYRELWAAMSGLAERLEGETEPGQLVGILLPPAPMFPVALLACLAAGRPFVALDIHYPPEWLGLALAETPPALIVAGPDAPGPAELAPAIPVVRVADMPGPASRGWRPATVDADDAACVVFTSGSSGRPKGIVNSQRNLLQRAAQSINAAHINEQDTLLTVASPCTIVGVRDMITALVAGARLHLLDPQRAGAREISRAIDAESVTILFAFPALLRSIAGASGRRAAPSLRLARVGGDTTLWSDVDMLRAWLRPGADIQVVFAATEAPMMQWFVDDGCRGDEPRVPIGYPLPGNSLALIDSAGRPVSSGDVGELIVASRYVSLGRWSGGGIDPASVEVDVGGQERVFRTGDLARQRPDGLLERVGRKDRHVKIRGTRVDLDGVEAVLRSHALVRDAGVVARVGGGDGAASLAAYVTPHEGAPAGFADELRTFVRGAPPPMRPSVFYMVASIPRLPNSKLDVRTLAAMDAGQIERERLSGSKDPAFVFLTADRVEQAVATAWRSVLRTPVRSVEDDFFDCGGDSLSAIAFTLELERALGTEISLALVNEVPQFDRLCQALREPRTALPSSLVMLKTGEGKPPLFFIHGIGGGVVRLRPAARRLAYAGAVIGVRARGFVSGERVHTTVEAMAEDYMRDIQLRQPEGPYRLCGYSFGGLVAFELARRLSEAGHQVALVGLFDTGMSAIRRPFRSWLSSIGRRVTNAAGGRASASSAPPPDARGWAERYRAWRDIVLLSPIAFKVAAGALLASARYRPRFYEGRLTLFSPADRDPGLPSLESVWRTHARAITVVETEGTHATMLSVRHAESTAAHLTRCLTP